MAFLSGIECCRIALLLCIRRWYEQDVRQSCHMRVRMCISYMDGACTCTHACIQFIEMYLNRVRVGFACSLMQLDIYPSRGPLWLTNYSQYVFWVYMVHHMAFQWYIDCVGRNGSIFTKMLFMLWIDQAEAGRTWASLRQITDCRMRNRSQTEHISFIAFE
jgi:hypothetical protein